MLKRLIWWILNGPRLDKYGNANSSAILGEFRRRLFERNFDNNYFLEYIAPLKTSQEYSVIEAEQRKGFTAQRMSGRRELMRYLVSLTDTNLRSMSWLELGCADGANLMALSELGCTNLSGVELNRTLLNAGKEYDSNILEAIDLHCMPIEKFVENGTTYDIVLCCAILPLINPQQNYLFKKIAEKSTSYLVCIESEDQCNAIHYPRNFGRVFQRFGFSELHSEKIMPDTYEGVSVNHLGYTIRLLKRVSQTST